jgi:5'-nucleotidase
MEPEQKEALVDLDGTLADYHKAMMEQLALIASPTDPQQYAPGWSSAQEDRERIPWMEARCDLIKKQPGFWRSLERIEDGFTVVRLMENLNFLISVLTKGPVRTTSAWTEKAEWCAENLPNADVTVTHNKRRVYGRVLFDDYPSYAIGWLKHRPRGLVLMLEQPWNQTFTHPQVVKVPRPFVGEDVVGPVRAALIRARDT